MSGESGDPAAAMQNESPRFYCPCDATEFGCFSRFRLLPRDRGAAEGGCLEDLSWFSVGVVLLHRSDYFIWSLGSNYRGNYDELQGDIKRKYVLRMLSLRRGEN